MKERTKYDIDIPQPSQTYSRNYKDISAFDITQLPTGANDLNNLRIVGRHISDQAEATTYCLFGENVGIGGKRAHAS